MRLSDLYDADKRTAIAEVRSTAQQITIPHPLNNVQYGDGLSKCRHSKKHGRWQACHQEVKSKP